MAIVYRHIRKDTKQVFYIGVGKYNKRAWSKANRNKHWHNIVNKVGFEYEILYSDLSYEDALIKESELIKSIGRVDLGSGPLINYNDGGKGGSNPSLETRRLRSISHTGKKLSDKTKAKLSDINKGKVLSTETKRRMSASRRSGVIPKEFAKSTKRSLKKRTEIWNHMDEAIKLRLEGWTFQELGKKFNTYYRTVRHALKRQGIV